MGQGSDEMLFQAAIQIVIAVAVPVLTGLAVMWVRQAVARGKAQLSQEQLFLIDGVLRMFVRAAEQYDLGGALKRTGQEKKAWVVDQSQGWLAGQGVHLDVGALADLAEGAVLSELNMGKTLKIPNFGEESNGLGKVERS